MQNFIHIYHFEMLRLAVRQDTCHSIWPCSPRVSHSSVVRASNRYLHGRSWVRLPLGPQKLIIFLSISTWERFSVIYSLSKSPIHWSFFFSQIVLCYNALHRDDPSCPVMVVMKQYELNFTLQLLSWLRIRLKKTATERCRTWTGPIRNREKHITSDT